MWIRTVNRCLSAVNPLLIRIELYRTNAKAKFLPWRLILRKYSVFSKSLNIVLLVSLVFVPEGFKAG